MLRMLLLSTVGIATTLLPTDSALAQISVGVTRQGGIVTGGSLQVGGYVTNGSTGVRLGVNTGFSQLLGINTFNVQNGAQNPGGQNQAAAANRRGPKATPDMFVKAAARFDEDDDQQFDEEELAAVGAAVLAELRERDRQLGKTRRRATRSARRGSTPPVIPEEVQIRAFVKRCLKFDKDKDSTLNEKEMRKMAAVLIRSLS